MCKVCWFILAKDSLYFISGYSTSTAIYKAFIVGVFGYVFSKFQYMHGTRFFLPNRFRTKKHEYRRYITEDFELTKMDETYWPEWEYWMQKLHQPSILYRDKSLCKIEKDQWYEMYMKSKEGINLHFFWLLEMHYGGISINGDIPSIDEFDD